MENANNIGKTWEDLVQQRPVLDNNDISPANSSGEWLQLQTYLWKAETEEC